jgi:hypothetical protein
MYAVPLPLHYSFKSARRKATATAALLWWLLPDSLYLRLLDCHIHESIVRYAKIKIIFEKSVQKFFFFFY